MNTLEKVREWHAAFGVHTGKYPGDIDPDTVRLRIVLLREELEELEDAWHFRSGLHQILDALIDLQYVLDGAFLAFGMQALKDEAFAEVHRSNMSKLGADGKPVRREDGKVLKGPNYSPPDLKALLERRVSWIA